MGGSETVKCPFLVVNRSNAPPIICLMGRCVFGSILPDPNLHSCDIPLTISDQIRSHLSYLAQDPKISDEQYNLLINALSSLLARK